jgi:hypothetical protein
LAPIYLKLSFFIPLGLLLAFLTCAFKVLNAAMQKQCFALILGLVVVGVSHEFRETQAEYKRNKQARKIICTRAYNLNRVPFPPLTAPAVPTWTCPHCGFVHRPAALLRLDGEHLQCKGCKAFESLPDSMKTQTKAAE